MRALVVLLLVLNLVFFAWSRGWLDRITGIPAQGSSEAHRLQRQEHPNASRSWTPPPPPP